MVCAPAASPPGPLNDIDLDVRRGEILGIGGLLGQGQEELLLALFGAHDHTAEQFEVAGRPIRLASPRRAIDAGIAYIPADRKIEGLHLDQPIAFNMALAATGRLAWHGVRRLGAERRLIDELWRRFAVRGLAPAAAAVQLSGGNQQKVAIAKWLALDPPVLLLNDPTRGIDVETKREIYLLLRRLAAKAGPSFCSAAIRRSWSISATACRHGRGRDQGRRWRKARSARRPSSPPRSAPGRPGRPRERSGREGDVRSLLAGPASAQSRGSPAVRRGGGVRRPSTSISSPGW